MSSPVCAGSPSQQERSHGLPGPTVPEAAPEPELDAVLPLPPPPELVMVSLGDGSHGVGLSAPPAGPSIPQPSGSSSSRKRSWASSVFRPRGIAEMAKVA